MVLCVVPRDLERKIAGTLERSFAGSDVRVLVERRGGDRRVRERRALAGRSERILDRRRVRASAGRRVAERRSTVVPVDVPALPRRARGHARRLQFVMRLETPRQVRDDIAAARRVVSFQLGDRDAVEHLYLAWFDAVYAFTAVALGAREAAVEATQEAFTEAVRGLGELDPVATSFRAHLFGHVVEAVRRRSVPDSVPEPVPPRGPGRRGTPEPAPLALVTDPELRVLIGRMPYAEREVMLLRYLVGLGDAEVAALLDLNLEQALELRTTALSRIRRALEGNAGGVGTSRREAMRRRHCTSPVLRGRKLALLAG